jgi:hypothetical protein
MIFSSPFKFKKDTFEFSNSDLFLGVLVLVSICSINAWAVDVRSEFVIFLAFLIFITIFFYNFKRLTYRGIHFTIGAKTTIASTLILTTVSTLIGYKSRLYYVNPDPYGYMGLTGALKKYGSIPAIFSEWSKYTGTDFKFELNWDIPVQLLKSPWLVPDMQIRYAADSLNIPRIGISSFIASVPDPFFSAGLANVLFLSIILFSCSALIGSLVEISLNKNTKQHSKITKIQISLLIGSIFLIAPWIQVMIFEGFTAQIVAFTATVIAFDLIFSKKILVNGKLDMILLGKLFIIIVSTYFIYLQQLPILLFAIFILVIYEFLNGKMKHKTSYFALVTSLIAVSLTSLFLPGTRYLLRQIGGTTGHGAVHLGTPGIFDLFGLNINFFGKRIEEPIQTSTQIFSNTSNSGIGMFNDKIGYSQYLTSATGILLQGFIAATLIILILILLKLKKIENQLIIPTGIIVIMTLFYSFYYIYKHVYQAFDNYINNKQVDAFFSDYVWLRTSGIILIFSYIFIALFINILVNNSNIFSKKIIILLTFFVFIFSFSNYTYTSKQYITHASPGIINDCKYFKNISNPIFVWDNTQPNQVGISLTLCSFPIFALTDPFPSTVPISNVPYNVVYLYYSKNEKIWTANIIGRLTVDNLLQNPCDKACLEGNPKFSKFETPMSLF